MTDITEYALQSFRSRIVDQVSDLSSRVYTNPPQKASFPYVYIEWICNDIEVKGYDMQEWFFTCHIYAQRGTKSAIDACLDLKREMHNALNNYNDLVLSIGNTVSLTYEGATPIPEDDGKTYHIAVRYKLIASNSN